MNSLERYRIVMADEPDLEAFLRDQLAYEFSQGSVDLSCVREHVSSPRLTSFGVKAFCHPGLVLAGDSYLSKGPILGDRAQRTYAISIKEWGAIDCFVERLVHADFRDEAVMRLEVWSVDPRRLSPFAMAIAVAMSYKRSELLAESRISLALDELVTRWGYFTDDF